jgi:hypothetical protein
MEFWQMIPESIWAQGLTPILGFVLVATGVLVTRREHTNMIKLMEYFRTLSEKKDETIRILTEAVDSYKETAQVTKQTVETVRDIAKKRDEE